MNQQVLWGIFLAFVAFLFLSDYGSLTGYTAVASNYQLIFNPTQQALPDSGYVWEDTHFSSQQQIPRGKGAFVLQRRVIGDGPFVAEIRAQPGWAAIGVLGKEQKKIEDLEFAVEEQPNKITTVSFTQGLDTGIFSSLYMYDSTKKAYGSVLANRETLLEPGNGYFFKTAKPFVMKMKSLPEPEQCTQLPEITQVILSDRLHAASYTDKVVGGIIRINGQEAGQVVFSALKDRGMPTVISLSAKPSAEKLEIILYPGISSSNIGLSDVAVCTDKASSAAVSSLLCSSGAYKLKGITAACGSVHSASLACAYAVDDNPKTEWVTKWNTDPWIRLALPKVC